MLMDIDFKADGEIQSGVLPFDSIDSAYNTFTTMRSDGFDVMMWSKPDRKSIAVIYSKKCGKIKDKTNGIH